MNHLGNMAKKIRFSIDPAKGCFRVISHKLDRNGYPLATRCYQQIYLHRHIWQECFGPIPEGMCICHHCDSKNCINSEHLFMGTQRDNMRDMMAKGRGNQARGEKSGKAKLTEAIVKEIRKRYKARDRKDGRNAMAREFHVSQSAIGDVLERSRWGWLL